MTAHERIRQAARDGLRNWVAKEGTRFSTEAADFIASEICWQLRQRPIELTEGEVIRLHDAAAIGRQSLPKIIINILKIFQSRYLFSEELEVPEEIKDLCESWDCESRRQKIEIYRRGFERGQHAKEQG